MEIQLIVAVVYHILFLLLLIVMYVKANRLILEVVPPKHVKAVSTLALGIAILLALAVGIVTRVVYYVLSQGVVQ